MKLKSETCLQGLQVEKPKNNKSLQSTASWKT